MYRILPLLEPAEIAQLRQIAAKAPFVDGKITNPANTAKQNLQLHDAQAYEQSSAMVRDAMLRSPEFMEFTFATALAPPLMAKYQKGMKYGTHGDAAYLQLPKGIVRSDLSCTVFLNDPDEYEGGALRVWLGEASIDFKLKPGEAIVYPSNALHEVTEVTKGERLVAITFIQSRVSDPFKRHMLYELGEIAALEGNKMEEENHMKLRFVRESLYRYWSASGD
ncbi:Fe2+-dependent dioxygenase [Sphingomicrobium flavum]|uniref:Fe2+-dependent dioxygenase n=1 Tax=Sphingomicrobium flavum TaxID=1229164 RepID=UPI0021AE12C7|nr:Fe2+-dependent dioxygenase [Sphingomicrobium flavum]